MGNKNEKEIQERIAQVQLRQLNPQNLAKIICVRQCFWMYEWIFAIPKSGLKWIPAIRALPLLEILVFDWRMDVDWNPSQPCSQSHLVITATLFWPEQKLSQMLVVFFYDNCRN